MHELNRSGMQFALSRDVVTHEEGRIFEADLDAQGLDHAYWLAMNGLLGTASRSDTPLALRAYRSGRLAGIAFLIECRRTSRCLFPGLAGKVLDVLPMPGYCWTRGDPGVDLMASPGLLAEGEDPRAFYQQAIAFLNTRYTMGSVLEERGTAPAGSCYESPMMDWGRYRVAPGGTDLLVSRHAHLRRKHSKFRNKAGTLDVVAGPLAPAARDAVLRCVEQSAGAGLVRAPFQDNYRNMVQWATAQGGPEIVHLLARLEGQIVGYHAYLRTGWRLQCLSGGFDRTRHSTYHAYENILLQTMRYAEATGIREVAFGPVSNPSKLAVMPELASFVVRFYSRRGAVRRVLTRLIPRSALRPAVFAPFCRAGTAIARAPALQPAAGTAADRDGPGGTTGKKATSRASVASVLFGVAVMTGAAGCGSPPAPVALSAYRIVDLTHPYNERTVNWPTSPTTFTLAPLAYGRTEAGFFYAANTLCTPEHGGTHLDAPIHFAEGRRTTDEVPLEQLIAPAVVIDVTAQAGTDRNYRLAPEDVRDFERQHGDIPPGSIVLLRTGWSRHWPDVAAYLGDDTPGDASNLSFPGYGAEAATLLVHERRVGVLGIDTASIDYGRSTDFPVHRIAADENVPALENLASLDPLPPTGALVIALPMKIEGGSGGPLRAVALVGR